MAKSPQWHLVVKDNRKNNPDGHTVMRYILNIALLPSKKAEEGLKITRELIDEKFKNDLELKKNGMLSCKNILKNIG